MALPGMRNQYALPGNQVMDRATKIMLSSLRLDFRQMGRANAMFTHLAASATTATVNVRVRPQRSDF